MSRGQGELDARELVFREGFVGIDTPLEEELAGALDGVPYKIYVGVVRLFRGRPGGTTMRELAEQLHQDHAQVVRVLPQLEALHLIAYETTARGTRIEVLPCSAQALVALRLEAEERLGAKARFSRRANQRLARARDELGLPQSAAQPPRPKRRRPSGGRAAGLAAGASSARQPPACEAPAWRGDAGEPGGLLAGCQPGGLTEASPWATDSQAPQPAAAPPNAATVELASEPPPAPAPSPEPLADRQPAGGLASQPAQPVAAPQEPAPPADPEPAPGEPPASSQPSLAAPAGQPAGEPAADPEAPAVLVEATGRLAPPAELPGSPTPQPTSDQPAEARTGGGSATDEGQGDQLASGGVVLVSQQPAEAAAPGGEPEAELAGGGLGAQQVAQLGGVLTPPPGGVLTPPPEGGAPNCSLDPFLQIPPSLPSPALSRGASQPEGGRGESLAPPAAEPASHPTLVTCPGVRPLATQPPPSDRPALEALGALVTLACSLWPRKLHPSAAERWLQQAIALVEPAPSRAEMAAFLRWAAEEESLTKAAVPLAAAVSPGRFVPWMTRRRAKPQPPGAAAPQRALQDARDAEARADRDAAESRRLEEKVARAVRLADKPEHQWPRLGPKAPATLAPEAPVGTPAPRPADERAPYERAFTFLSADLRTEGQALLAIPRAERTDLQRQRFARLQQLALQAEARRELAEREATEGTDLERGGALTPARLDV